MHAGYIPVVSMKSLLCICLVANVPTSTLTYTPANEFPSCACFSYVHTMGVPFVVAYAALRQSKDQEPACS